jgi:hypothetical protein
MVVEANPSTMAVVCVGILLGDENGGVRGTFGGLFTVDAVGLFEDVSSGNAGKVRITDRGDFTDASARFNSCEKSVSVVLHNDVESATVGCEKGKLDIIDELGKSRDAAASKQRESA